MTSGRTSQRTVFSIRKTRRGNPILDNITVVYCANSIRSINTLYGKTGGFLTL